MIDAMVHTLMENSKLVVINEDVPHGQSQAKVAPLEQILPPILGHQAPKPRYFFMKWKLPPLDPLPPTKKGSLSTLPSKGEFLQIILTAL